MATKPKTEETKPAIPTLLLSADTSFGMLALKALYRETNWEAWTPEEQKFIQAKMREFELFHEGAL